MNRFDIINRIGDKYRVGNTETGEFSYAQALKTVGKDIKDYQKATTGTQHKFLDIRFENERLVVLVECKNKFSRWDKAKIQGQLQDYVRLLMPNWMSTQKQLLLSAGTIPPRLPVVAASILYFKVAIFPTMIILCQREKVSTTCFCSSWRKS